MNLALDARPKQQCRQRQGAVIPGRTRRDELPHASIFGVGVPDTDLQCIARYCAAGVPARVRDQVRVEYTLRGWSVTIIETRPPWDGIGDWTRRPVAPLRHDGRGWDLWWPDRRTRWHRVDASPAATPQPLLEILDDPGRAPFW